MGCLLLVSGARSKMPFSDDPILELNVKYDLCVAGIAGAADGGVQYSSSGVETE